MGDAIEYCDQCKNNVGCHLERKCLNAVEPQKAGSDQRLVRHCVSHHFACECREALMAESMRTQRRVIDWRDQSDEGLRLRCGELSAQEIRTIRVVLKAILPPNETSAGTDASEKTL